VALTILSAHLTLAQAPAPPTSFAGCYSVVRGAWILRLGTDSAFHRIPNRVRLDTIPVDRDGWRLSPDIDPAGNRFPGTPRWNIRGDSAILLWSNGFTPTNVTLHHHGDVLSGTAFAHSDAIGPGPPPHALIELHRIACSADLGFRHR